MTRSTKLASALLPLAALWVGCAELEDTEATSDPAAPAEEVNAAPMPRLETIAAPEEVDVMVQFTARLDLTTGEIEFNVTDEWHRTEPIQRAGLSGDLTSVEQELGFCSIAVDTDATPGVPGRLRSMELYSVRARSDAEAVMFHGEDDGAGGVWDCNLPGDDPETQYDTFGAICTDVLIRSWFSEPVDGVYAQIDNTVPATFRGYAHPVGTGAAPPRPGLNNALGLWFYGDFEASNDVNEFGVDLIRPDNWQEEQPDERIVRWVFEYPLGLDIESVYFNGRIFGSYIEECNDEDDDCDGRVDEGVGCYDVGESCEENADCASGVCYLNTCVDTGDTCEFTEDCEVDEYCEPAFGLCLPDSIRTPCEFVPPIGDFEPAEDCRWTPAGLEFPAFDDVVGTPVVINLTDDNEDGLTNRDDDPEIVFLSYDLAQGCCNRNAVIRVVSGQCNPDGTMNTIATLSDRRHTNDTGIAAGDLDGDGVPEIVVVGMDGSSNNPQGIVIYERVADDGSEWRVRAENTEYPTWNVHTRGGPVISLADLEGDGLPEIIVGNVVLNADATLKWDGVVTSGGTGGIGNNAFLGPSSAIADVDLDGEQEVIAGNTLYEADGTVAWTFNYTTENSRCSGGLPCDGFNAVGNFDADDFGEIVSVRLGEVFVWEHTGEQLARIPLPRIDCANNESGPPTVADFDGDGRPEIGTASADYYVVADLDCIGDEATRPAECEADGILWQQTNEDCTSRATGSSVFDFEGDGSAEVVYADETSFRIFDGRTGAVLFNDPTHGSHTRIEMPVVADIDNDGNSEVVIPENGSRGGRPGIDVWGDPGDNWVRTRRVWNQHGYSVTSVTEDGQIPASPEPNWLNGRLNNFRQNVQPAGVFDAPDLRIRELSIPASANCPLSRFQVVVTVQNAGALSIPPGQPILIDAFEDGVYVTSALFETRTRILPGAQEAVLGLVEAPAGAFEGEIFVRAFVDPDNEVNECQEGNNQRQSATLVCEF